MDSNSAEYLSVINQNAVRLDVPAKNKNEAFLYAAEMLFGEGVLSDKDEFVKDLHFRESLGPTGIGDGVAIPHGKSKAVKQTCISILKLAEPIEWETTDGKPVRILIMFAVSEEDKTDRFLRLMAQVARKLAREGVCEMLAAAESKEAIMKALS